MPEIEVPAPRFAPNAPLDTGWPLVEPTLPLPHPVVAPGGQPDPDHERARLARCPVDHRLHVVPRTEVLAARLVNYAHALCGRRIEGELTVASAGSGDGFCLSCLAGALS